MMDHWIIFGAYGIGHWIAFAIAIAVVLYPIGRILRRVGLSPFWSVLAVIPLLNLIGLWVLAFADWPAEGRAVGAPGGN